MAVGRSKSPTAAPTETQAPKPRPEVAGFGRLGSRHSQQDDIQRYVSMIDIVTRCAARLLGCCGDHSEEAALAEPAPAAFRALVVQVWYMPSECCGICGGIEGLSRLSTVDSAAPSAVAG